MQRKRPTKVVQYLYAIDKQGEKLRPKQVEAIGKFFNGENSVYWHPINWPTSFDVSAISYGEKERLLLTYKECKGERYCIVTEDLSQHEYVKAFTPRSEHLATSMATFEKSLADGIFIPVEMKEKEEVEDYYFFDNKFLKLTPIQKKIVEGDFPQYNFGAAGGGKTVTDIALLEEHHAKGSNVMYMTQSPELVAKVRDVIDRKHVRSTDENAPDLAALSYLELIKLIDPDLEDQKQAGEEAFNNWVGKYLNARKGMKVPQGLIDHKDEIYRELRNLSGYESDVVFTLGKKGRSFFLTEEEKKWLLQIYQDYEKHLALEKQFDPSFYVIKDYSLFEDYVVALDEVDNFSNLQIRQLIRLANRRIVITGDSHQLMDDFLPKRPFITRLLGDGCEYNALPISMRCGKAIIELANKLIRLKYKAVGGQVDKKEQPQIDVPENQHEGSVGWTGIADAKTKELRGKYNATELVVITYPEFVEEARRKFPDNLVCTFAQSKGREFEHVALYRLFDTKLFEQIDEKLAGTGSKEKYHLPKESDRANLSFLRAFNPVFVGITRAIKSVTICQADNHKVKNIIKELRPVSAPAASSGSSVPAPKPVAEKKEESPTARLDRAKVFLRDGDLELAIQERERLSEEQKKEFDEYKFNLDARRKEQAERERARQEKRREKKETPPASSPPQPSAPVAAASSGVSRVPQQTRQPAKQASPSLATPPTRVTQRAPAQVAKFAEKKPDVQPSQDANPKDLLDYLLTGNEGLLFKPDKNGGCFFMRYASEEMGRKALLDLIETNPNVYSRLSVSDLFREYRYSGELKVSLIAFVYQDEHLHPFLPVMLSNLTDEDLALFLKKSQDRIKLPPHGYLRFLLDAIAVNCPSLFVYLIDRYPAFSSLVTPEMLYKRRKSGLRGDELDSMLFTFLCQTREGCVFLKRLIQKNPALRPSPRNMFRFLDASSVRPEGTPEDESVRTPFAHIAENLDDKYDFLTQWLEGSDWIEYVDRFYRDQASNRDACVFFTDLLIDAMLYLWQESPQQPILRLLMAKPLILQEIAKYNFFKNPGITFALLAQDPRFHPYLKALFDENPELINQIDVEEFFVLEKDESNCQPPFITLTRSKAGRELFLKILRARPDILALLASLDSFFEVFSFRDESGNMAFTCFYNEIAKSEEKDQFISLLQPDGTLISLLTDDFLKQTQTDLGLDFLTDEESNMLEEVLRNPSLDSLASVFTRSDAPRLLFQKNKYTLQYFIEIMLREMITSTSFSEALKGMYERYPELIARFPSKFLFTRSYSNDQGHAFPVINVLIKRKQCHGFLDLLLTQDDFVSEVVRTHATRKLSDGLMMAMLCRYHPAFVFNLAERAKQAVPGTHPATMLFGNPSMIASHFYWLAKYPPAHELLFTSYASKEFAFDQQVFPQQFGLSLKAEDTDGASTPMQHLVQTIEGRGFLKFYMDKDNQRAKKLATPNILCTPIKMKDSKFDGKDALTILKAEMRIDLVASFIRLNPSLIDHLSVDLALAMGEQLEDEPVLIQHLSDRMYQLGRMAGDGVSERGFFAHSAPKPSKQAASKNAGPGMDKM